MSKLRNLLLVLGATTAWLGLPVSVQAHPHVFVDARAELVFDAEGRIAAVRNIWQFDDAFSAYAVEGLDTNGDGKLSAQELKPLAEVNVKSLKEFAFFTYLVSGQVSAKFLPVKDYWLEFHADRLTLFFTLPVKEPLAVGTKTTLEIFDPEYFVAFAFDKNHAMKLTGAPTGCGTVFHPPHDLDAQTMATLAAIPVDQHDLPPDLVNVAAVLANHFTISCR